MEKLLIFIKHRFGFLWKLIEWGNGLLFSILHERSMERVLPSVFSGTGSAAYTFRRLTPADAEALHGLIASQEASDLLYFRPHGFDLPSIKKQFKKRAFLMMGSFDQERMTGYFFLRFFANKKCFVGRLIDREYRGKGIGNMMNDLMYGTAWRMGFRCLSTMSKNNRAVMHAHAKNASMIRLKELRNDYILVEFVNPQKMN
jgi:RimJ/RimL family protein N-acetyltransferase